MGQTAGALMECLGRSQYTIVRKLQPTVMSICFIKPSNKFVATIMAQASELTTFSASFAILPHRDSRLLPLVLQCRRRVYTQTLQATLVGHRPRNLHRKRRKGRQRRPTTTPKQQSSVGYAGMKVAVNLCVQGPSMMTTLWSAMAIS